MRINAFTYNTMPNKKDGFWQVVLIPTISVLNGVERRDPYTAVNFEWLFWSFSLIFKNEKTGSVTG